MGEIKIKYALRHRQINEDCIKRALNEINEIEYLKTFNILAEQKIDALKPEKNLLIRKKRLQDYLLQKGYEPDMVTNLLRKQKI